MLLRGMSLRNQRRLYGGLGKCSQQTEFSRFWNVLPSHV